MPQPFIKGATNASALYKGNNKCLSSLFHDKNNIAPLDAGMLIVITATMSFITVQSESVILDTVVTLAGTDWSKVLYWTQWSLYLALTGLKYYTGHSSHSICH